MSNKHEATYHGGEYVPDTPTTEQIRSAWTDPEPGVSDEQFYSAEAFDRWLATVKAEAWQEGFNDGVDEEKYGYVTRSNPYKDAP